MLAVCRVCVILLVLTLHTPVVWSDEPKDTKPKERGRITLEFDLIRGQDVMLVNARVNGSKAVLLVDTGAAQTIVRPEIVGLRPLDLRMSSAAQGPGFRGEAIWAEARLDLDHTTWEKRRVVVMNFEEVSRHFGRKIDGILGQDLLREFSRVEIDFRQKQITLYR